MPDLLQHSAHDSARWREIILLRRRLVSLKAQTRLLRHELARKYNPDQPRLPAGNADGGQWTSGGGGATPTGTDVLGDLGNAFSTALNFGDVVPDASGEESWAFYQDATRPDARWPSVPSSTVTARRSTPSSPSPTVGATGTSATPSPRPTAARPPSKPRAAPRRSATAARMARSSHARPGPTAGRSARRRCRRHGIHHAQVGRPFPKPRSAQL